MAFSPHGTTHRSTVTGRRGLVASAHPLASLAGLRILTEGGNAIDAAVATAAALNVVEPYMSGIGGDGYMHIYHTQSGDHKILDYMGLSPKAAHLDQYPHEEMLKRGPRSPLVPGACGGWLEALDRYGTMDAATVFGPAIEYAEQGFAITVKNSEFIDAVAADIAPYPATVEAYLPNGKTPRPGDTIVQPDLARTFRTIAEGGAEVFYRGEIADKIVRYLAEHDGLITHEDLDAFQAEWQDPIHIRYRDYKIFAPAPPCQGIQYLEILKIMEGFDVGQMGHNSAADRAEYAALENPPTAGLISSGYATERRNLIGDRAKPTGGERYTSTKMAGEIVAGDPYGWMQSECTTHFDTIDAEGNAVAVTQSLGGGFGSGVVVPGTKRFYVLVRSRSRQPQRNRSSQKDRDVHVARSNLGQAWSAYGHWHTRLLRHPPDDTSDDYECARSQNEHSSCHRSPPAQGNFSRGSGRCRDADSRVGPD